MQIALILASGYLASFAKERGLEDVRYLIMPFNLSGSYAEHAHGKIAG